MQQSIKNVSNQLLYSPLNFADFILNDLLNLSNILLIDFSNSLLLVSRNFSSISFVQQVFELIEQYLSETPGKQNRFHLRISKEKMTTKQRIVKFDELIFIKNNNQVEILKSFQIGKYVLSYFGCFQAKTCFSLEINNE